MTLNTRADPGVGGFANMAIALWLLLAGSARGRRRRDRRATTRGLFAVAGL